MPRTAICISGQLRDIDHVHPSLLKLIDRIDCDVLVHTWEVYGHPPHFERYLPGSVLKNLFVSAELKSPPIENNTQLSELFPAFAAGLFSEAGKHIDISRVEEIFRAKHVVTEELPQSFGESETLFGVQLPASLWEAGLASYYKSSGPMFYKIRAAHAEALAQLGVEYDYYIRLRPDCVIEGVDSVIEGINAAHFDPDSINAFRHPADDPDFVSDMFAIGGLEVMQIYTEVWSHLSDYWDIEKYPSLTADKRGGGHLLYYHLMAHGVDIQTIDGGVHLHNPQIIQTEDTLLDWLFQDASSGSAADDRRDAIMSYLADVTYGRKLKGVSDDALQEMLFDINAKCTGSAKPRLVLAQIYERLDQSERVEAPLREAYTSFRKLWVEPCLAFARWLRKMEDLPAAIGVLTETCLRYPRNHVAWRTLGVYFRAIGDFEQAQRYLHKAADLSSMKDELSLIELISSYSGAQEAVPFEVVEALRVKGSRHPVFLAYLEEARADAS